MENLISIIIPTYNRAHLIGETIGSIKQQSYKNWECLIIDDGSTDDTEKVLESFLNSDKRIQYYKKPKDILKGPSAARNYGFEKSKGAYINFFDSDDLMHPEKLEIDLKNIQSGDYDFTISQSKFFNATSDSYKKVWNTNLWSDDPINDFIVSEIGWSTNAPMWKRTSLKKNNLLFDEDLITADDYFYHIEALAKGLKPHVNTAVLVKQRVHPERLENFKVKSPFKLKVNLYLIRNSDSLRLNEETIIFINKQFEQQFSNLLKNRKLSEANQFLPKSLKSPLNISTKRRVIELWFFGIFYYYIGYGYKFLR